MTDNI